MSFLITFAVKVKSTTVQGSRNHPRENVKANLVIGNIPVANGVVHLIDKPLIIVASPLWDYLQEEVRLLCINDLQRNQWPQWTVQLYTKYVRVLKWYTGLSLMNCYITTAKNYEGGCVIVKLDCSYPTLLIQ